MLALVIAVGIPVVAVLLLKHPWHAGLLPWLDCLAGGPRELAAHLLFGLPAALLSAVAIRAFRLGPLRFRPDLSGAAVLTALSVLVSAPFVSGPGPGFTGWGLAGNLVSNFYEELSFLALPVLGVLRWRNLPLLATVLSGVVCALPRWDQPWPAQLNLFLLGALYAAAFCRDYNLFGPWLAHSLTDLIFSWG